MGQYGISSQSATIALSNDSGDIGPFGGTKIKQRRTYSNADTTTTYSTEQEDPSSGWEESISITRGMLVDVEVPLKDDVNISLLDQWFDDQVYDSDTPTPFEVVVTYPLQNNAQRSFDAILETHDIDASAKDAMRLTFTLKVTGEVVFSNG